MVKNQTTGRIDSTDRRTGQPRTNVNVALCAHIKVVCGGNNLTSPSTCADHLLVSGPSGALSARLEKSDHRSNAAVIVSSLGQVQLVQNASHVFLDSAFGEPQLMGDAGVGTPLCHERQNLVFSRTQSSKRIYASAS